MVKTCLVLIAIAASASTASEAKPKDRVRDVKGIKEAAAKMYPGPVRPLEQICILNGSYVTDLDRDSSSWASSRLKSRFWGAIRGFDYYELLPGTYLLDSEAHSQPDNLHQETYTFSPRELNCRPGHYYYLEWLPGEYLMELRSSFISEILPMYGRKRLKWLKHGCNRLSKSLAREYCPVTVTDVSLSGEDTELATSYRSEAERDIAEEQFRLGRMYDDGKGAPEDDVTAVKYYRGAAALGHPTAQLLLGLKYILGEGVQKDYVQAYVWLSLAVAQGAEGAEEARLACDSVLLLMTDTQKAEAQTILTDWQSKKSLAKSK